MLEKINAIKEEINAAVATNLQEVEELRIKYLSKKGSISQLMVDFRTVPAEMKRELGQKINELKNYATEKIASLKEGFATAADSDAEAIDLTRTATPYELGTRHPLSLVKNEMLRIFAGMGFTIAEGPEIEDDWHVFESLNFSRSEGYPFAHTYLFRPDPRDGENAAADPHRLSGSRIPQRGDFSSCPLFLPSGRGTLYRQECLFC